MAEIKYAVMKQKRNTFEWFQQNNPRLEDGQMGVVISGEYRGMFKFGDGATLWNSLPWGIGAAKLGRLGLVAGSNLELHGTISSNGSFTLNGLSEKLNTLNIRDNELAAAINNEAQVRQQADAVLDTKINQEAQARQQADADHAALTTAHDSTATPAADRIVMYGAECGLKSDKIPDQANDVIRKAELDVEHLFIIQIRDLLVTMLGGTRATWTPNIFMPKARITRNGRFRGVYA
jgi:hypothetical protein